MTALTDSTINHVIDASEHAFAPFYRNEVNDVKKKNNEVQRVGRINVAHFVPKQIIYP